MKPHSYVTARRTLGGRISLIGGYVLVDPEEVIWIVFSLNFQETIIVVSVGSL
jgi:hypothetical protein